MNEWMHWLGHSFAAISTEALKLRYFISRSTFCYCDIKSKLRHEIEYRILMEKVWDFITLCISINFASIVIALLLLSNRSRRRVTSWTWLLTCLLENMALALCCSEIKIQSVAIEECKHELSFQWMNVLEAWHRSSPAHKNRFCHQQLSLTSFSSAVDMTRNVFNALLDLSSGLFCNLSELSECSHSNCISNESRTRARTSEPIKRKNCFTLNNNKRGE